MNKHTHQYARVRIGKNKRVLMRCLVVGCVHTCAPELAVGRISICNRCFNEFVLDSQNIQLARPHCDACTESKKKSNVDLLAKVLEGKLG